MTLPELSIKRHVLALMLSLVLVLFGIISYQRIGVDRFPYIEFPAITVTTTLKGANPDVMDSSVTNVIETSVNAVAAVVPTVITPLVIVGFTIPLISLLVK